MKNPMGSTEPLLDLSSLLKKATDDTIQSSLHLTAWQQEYKEKMGLTYENTNDITSSSDQILPLHPYPLGLEIQHYQDQLDKVKRQYILLAAQYQFIDNILQDPPPQVEPDQIQELQTKVYGQHNELNKLLGDVTKLNHAIAEGNTNNEQGLQELNQTRDTIIQMIDEIEELKTNLEPLTPLIDTYATFRTPEQARQTLQDQTLILAGINDEMDTHRDLLEEMDSEIGMRQQEIKLLESTCRAEEYRAQEAIKKTGGSNIKLAEKEAKYKDMMQLWYTTFGIQQIIMDEIDLLQVKFITGDILSIHLDSVTEQVTGLEVNNEQVDLTDVEAMVNGEKLNDVAYIVMLETLARTREL